MPLIRKGCLKVIVSRRERMVMIGYPSETACSGAIVKQSVYRALCAAPIIAATRVQ